MKLYLAHIASPFCLHEHDNYIAIDFLVGLLLALYAELSKPVA